MTRYSGAPTISQQLGLAVPVLGGRAGRVLEFSGGHDPEVPQILTRQRIRGRLVIGHTTDLDDPAAPVWTDGRSVYPGDEQVIEGRCPGCIARVVIGGMDGHTMMILEHRQGCTWLPELLAGAR